MRNRLTYRLLSARRFVMLALLFPALCVPARATDAAPPTRVPTTGPVDRPQGDERLSFQTKEAYGPREHLNADIAMVYGIDKSLPDRMTTWRDKGYTVHVMTGVAWGDYQDYY